MRWLLSIFVGACLCGLPNAHDPSCRTVEDCISQGFHCSADYKVVCSSDRKRHDPRCECRSLHLHSSPTYSTVSSGTAKTTSQQTHTVSGPTEVTSQHIDTTTKSPAVDGSWSFWTEWSTCTASCDQGTQTRNRTCSNPAPSNGGQPCSGDKAQIQICVVSVCPVDGYMSAWGTWSTCSVTCGGGYQMRTRSCHDPVYGGKPCTGDAVEVNPACNNQSCPVASSTSTSPASTTTALPTTTTALPTTTTTLPSTTTTQPAITSQMLPVDGYMGEWGSWSACSATCGGGFQMRTRTCHDPLYGGKNCTGDVVDLNPSCNNQSCPLANTGTACPSCDEQLNCTWNQTCAVSSVCMIRSYEGYPFTTHCIDATDCEIMKNSLPHCEVYCCTDKACLTKYLGN